MHKALLFVLLLYFLCSCGQSQTTIVTTGTSQRLALQEDSILRKQFQQVYGQYIFTNEKPTDYQIDSKILYRNNYKITISNQYKSDSLPNSKCYLTIEDKNTKYVDILDFQSSVFVTSLNADVDIYNDEAFICWVSTGSEQDIPSTIWLKRINLKKQKIELYKKLYSQRWGIERIALVFNPFNNAIHFAYNDFSQLNSKYLYFGTIDCTKKNRAELHLSPNSVLNQDHWEKRYPKFIRTLNSIFLCNTTGDTWGFFAHTGKQEVGISQIDKNNNLTKYRVLADSNTVNEEILIANDTVFYQHVVGRNAGDFEIKKVRLDDLSAKE